MSTQFVKNTDVPSADSYLWQLGNNWKISQKTGDPYSPINNITDDQLGVALADIVESGNLDVIELEDGGFFVPSKFVDQKSGKVTWSVFAFENRVKANKKLEDGKKFANFQPKTQQQATVPKPQSTTQGQQTISKPVTASTASPTASTISTGKASTISETITTFTDPKPVDLENQEYIATLQTDGYSFLPRTLVEKNFWEQKIFDETGEEVGTKLIFLMGRIINVKIPDNS